MELLIGDKDKLLSTLKGMLEEDLYGVDTETTGLSPHKSQIRLVQLSTPKRVSVIDTYSYDRPWLMKVLRRFFNATADKPKIFANAKFDLQFFKKEGIEIRRGVHDVLAMFRVKHNGECSQFPTLVEVTNFYMGTSLTAQSKKEKQQSDWSGELTVDQYEYAGGDTLYLPQLYSILKTELQEDGNLWKVYNDIEIPCLHSVVDMEYNGIPVDPQVFINIYDKIKPEQEAATQEILGFFHEHDAPITNLNSWQQLVKAFAAIGVALPNTQQATLEACDHPIATDILAYKKRKSLLQFVVSLPTHMLEETGRIHGSFHPLGTDTGRFSGSSPNLQNIPRPIAGEDTVLRSFVKAPDGYTLVCADYSQLELVIAAEITQDRVMLETYRSGGDIHKLTASMILDKPIEEITKSDRQLAKAVNFG